MEYVKVILIVKCLGKWVEFKKIILSELTQT